MRIHKEDIACELENCPQCCPHSERDHGICLDCGHEEDPGAAIDRAMDLMEDR
jgi:ribosomal protein L32